MRWTLLAMIEAEDGAFPKSMPHRSRKLARWCKNASGGSDGKISKNFGLDPKWAMQGISAVGNYGEVFGRHLGKDNPLKIVVI